MMNNDEFFKASTDKELASASIMGQNARQSGLSRNQVNDENRGLRRDQRERYAAAWLTVWRNE